MSEITKKLPTLHTRATFRPDSLNDENRTIDIVFGTDTPVLMRGWDGIYYEILKFSSSNVRLARLNAGAPLLDEHDPDEQIGVVERAWLDGKSGYATLRFSKNDYANEIWNDVKDGIKRNVSVGYNVYSYREVDGGEDKISTYEAEDWEPYEISMVSMPADFNAGVRSKNNDIEKEVKILKLSNRTMAEETKPGATAPVTTEPANPVNVEQERKLATEAERKRVAEIKSSVRAARLDQAFEDKLINDGTSLEEARKLIIEEFAKNDPNKGANGHTRTASVTGGVDEVDKARAGMIGSMMQRLDPRVKLEGLELEASKDYRGLALIDLARECCDLAGVKTRGMSRREVATRAMVLATRDGGAGGMSTSDFAYVLGNVFHKRLVKAYEVFPRTFLPFCIQSSAVDFRSKLLVKFGDLGSFDQIPEGGEYKYGNIGDSQESYKVAKYGKLVKINWEAIVNDDLDAFSRLPKTIAQAAAQKQSDIVWALITGNPVMNEDNTTLFHTNHGNLASAGTAITIVDLGKGRAAMRKQKNLASQPLNLTPKFIVVGPDKEMEANQMTSANLVATKNLDINPSFNTSLIPIVEPRLTGNVWHLVADPSMIDTIEFSFLEGEGELFTEQRQGFEIDGIEMKARMVFGAGLVDYRGFYKNPGA